MTHIIRRGETLGTIAARYGTTVMALMRLNGIRNPDLIYTGQALRIPVANGNPQPGAPHPTGSVGAYPMPPMPGGYAGQPQYGMPGTMTSPMPTMPGMAPGMAPNQFPAQAPLYDPTASTHPTPAMSSHGATTMGVDPWGTTGAGLIPGGPHEHHPHEQRLAQHEQRIDALETRVAQLEARLRQMGR